MVLRICTPTVPPITPITTSEAGGMPEQLVIECAHEKSPNRFRCCIWLSARRGGRRVRAARAAECDRRRCRSRSHKRERRGRTCTFLDCGRRAEQKAKYSSESD